MSPSFSQPWRILQNFKRTKKVDLEKGIVKIQKDEGDINHIDDYLALEISPSEGLEIKRKIYYCQYCQRMYQYVNHIFKINS